jgi:hypothetical protein
LIMPMIFEVLVSAFQMLYQAQVPTFGCNSSAEVSELRKIRADADAFLQRLQAQMVYGQCIAIEKGAVVEGTMEKADTSVLRINAQKDPPGYMVPLDDFKVVRVGGKQ